MDRRKTDRDSRDLLIELKVQVSNLTQEFKDFKDNLGSRIDNLEKGKVGFNDIEALRSAFVTSSSSIEEKIDNLKTSLDDKLEDHEGRLRKIENKQTYWAGGLAVGQAVIAYILYHLLK